MACVQNYFRCTVPSCDDVFGQSRCGLLVAASQTEITDFEGAVLVEEQVGRLQISMDDVCRVHVIAAGQHLEHEVLQMVVS